MQNRNNILGVLCLVTALTGIIACAKKETTHTSQPAERMYSTVTLQLSSEVKEIVLPAELMPNEKVKIYSRTPGYLKKINVDIGDRVKEGQLLAEVDAPEQHMRLAELNERMHSAYSQYLSSKDASDRAYQLSLSPGFIAEADVVRLKHQKHADSLIWEATRFSLKNLQETINYLNIRSPISGVVTARYVDAGELIGADNGKHMLEIEDNSRLRLEVAIPETYTTADLQRKEIAFTVPSMPGRTFTATFARRSNALTANTKSEVWQFDTPNTDKRLKSGMYANVTLNLVRADSTFVIPASALVNTLERQYVIKVESDTARFVAVKTGFFFNNKIEVFGDLHQADIIVESASEQIKDGMHLTIQ
jgi:RND family efflux transporter MFP subunit